MKYVLMALIPLAAVLTVVILAKRIASHTFTCRHCCKQFNIEWPRVVITEHSGNEYKLVCPYCKTKDWCTEQTKMQSPDSDIMNGYERASEYRLV